MRILKWILYLPGFNLIVQAYHATLLALAIRHQRREAYLKSQEVVKHDSDDSFAQAPERLAEHMQSLVTGRHGLEFVRLFVPDLLLRLLTDLGRLLDVLPDAYLIGLAARFALCFTSISTGYIHPDEYFQSVEVAAGYQFGINVTETWEFDPARPLRSFIFTRLVYSLPMRCYPFLAWLLGRYRPSILTLCRLMLFVMSLFTVDLSVWCMARRHCPTEQDVSRVMAVLGSSCVTTLFITRTFSNSIEVMAFAWLLLAVTSAVGVSIKVCEIDRLVKLAYDAVSDDVCKRVDVVKLKRKLDAAVADDPAKPVVAQEAKVKGRARLSSLVWKAVYFETSLFPADLRYGWTIAVLTALATFNRPTFVAFAAAPLVFWIQRPVHWSSQKLRPSGGSGKYVFTDRWLVVHARLLLLFVGFCTATMICVAVDSWHYANSAEARITPINFVIYNAAPHLWPTARTGYVDAGPEPVSGSELHGIHPIWQHLATNLIYLFGPLYFCQIIEVTRFAKAQLLQLRRRSSTSKTVLKTDGPDLKTNSYLQNVTQLLLLLSVWIPPFALTLASRHREARFLLPVVVPAILGSAAHLFRRPSCSWIKALFSFKSFCIYNAIVALFLGCVHQAGVYRAVEYVSGTLMATTSSRSASVAFWRCYSPPTFLLAEHISSTLPSVAIHDLGDMSEFLLATYLHQLRSNDTSVDVFVVAPTSLASSLGDVRVVASFFPHFSGELLAYHVDYIYTALIDGHLFQTLARLKDALTLSLYSIEDEVTTQI